MKRRLLSVLLALVMLLTTAPTVFATNEADVQQELIDLACEVFPEYTNKILNQRILPSSGMRSSDMELVCSETRKVSDLQTVLYSEYSNGAILLTDITADPPNVTYVDIVNGSSSTVYTVNIRATCTGGYGSFTANNIKFSLISSAYDRIDSKGTHTIRSSTNEFEGVSLIDEDPNPSIVWNESASQNAKIEYKIAFKYATYGYALCETHLTLIVGDNNYTVSHTMHR